MHSHDRTLLAKLGFADPDKQNPTHDLACQYVGSPEVARKIANAALAHQMNPHQIDWVSHIDGRLHKIRGLSSTESFDLTTNYEVPLSKGEGQYRTTIGFLDAVIDVTLHRRLEGEKASHYDDNPTWTAYRAGHAEDAKVAIEVKVALVGVGEILRQINLYREYFNYRTIKVDPAWVVVTDFNLSPPDVEMLRRSGITPFRLSNQFDAWVARRREIAGTSNADEDAMEI